MDLSEKPRHFIIIWARQVQFSCRNSLKVSCTESVGYKKISVLLKEPLSISRNGTDPMKLSWESFQSFAAWPTSAIDSFAAS